MRSSRLNKRALELADEQDWPKKQEVEELDVPGNKAIAQPKAAEVEPKTADWVSDLIKQTVQFLTQHKNEADLGQKIQNLPIARKLGPGALQGPVAQFQQSGNSSALAGELETLLQGKRSLASQKKAEQEAPNEADAPAKPKTEAEQPETFKDPKRPEPAEKAPAPSADNGSDAHRRVKLDTVEHGGEAPTTFSVDNTREQPHKAGKKATPTAWSVDNTRQLPTEEKELTTEEQAEQKKNATLEVLTPKTAEELDLIVEASADWVGKRLATGTFQAGMPSFIVASDGDEPIAVVSAQGDAFDSTSDRPTNRYARLLKSAGFAVPDEAPINTHVAAEGGASEEEETEEQTSVDAVVVQLLESCKNEWTNLGDPVNPATWPKEIERAILNLNDEIVAAIQKVEDKLVEGEFYSKNVDEGVEGHGGSSLDGLNVAPMEEGAPVEPDMGMGLESGDAAAELDEEVEKMSSKEASVKTGAELPDVTSTETRKALKHTQSLKDDIASKFFDFKKVVQNANDSSIVKNIGETLVGLKVKLEEVEKVLSKQLEVLETAETAIEEKKKDNAKKAGEVPEAFKKNWKKPADGEKKEEEPKEEKKEAAVKTAACPTCGAKVLQNGVDTNGVPCPNCAAKTQQNKTPVGTTPSTTPKPPMPQNGPVKPSPVKQYGGPTASLRNLALAGGE